MTGIRPGQMNAGDLLAVAAMLAGLGFTVVILTELSERLRKRISGTVGR